MKHIIILISGLFLGFLNWGYAQTNHVCIETAKANWQSLGPTYQNTPNITNTYNDNSGAGWVNLVAFHPSDPNKIYLAGQQSGLWVSSNYGSTWNPLAIPTYNGYFDKPCISAFAISKSNPNIMYCATGVGDYSNVNATTGVYKSTNSGDSWTCVWTPSGNKDLNYKYVRTLKIHPTNPNVVFFGISNIADWRAKKDQTSGALYKTTDGANFFEVIGPNHDPVSPTGFSESNRITDIEFLPSDPSVVFCSGDRIFRSISNGDVGTWVAIDNLIPNYQNIDNNPGNSEEWGSSFTTFIEVADKDPNLTNQKTIMIYQYTYSNRSRWYSDPPFAANGNLVEYIHTSGINSVITQTINIKNQNLSCHKIAVDPRNLNNIYYSYDDYDQLQNQPHYPHRSTDRGVTWTSLGQLDHYDVRMIAVSPHTGDLFICDDGNLEKCTNPSVNTGYTVIQHPISLATSNSISVSEQNGNLLLATDHNYLFTFENSSQIWSIKTYLGDAAATIIDPKNPTKMYAQGQGSLINTLDGFNTTVNSVSGSSAISLNPKDSRYIYNGSGINLKRYGDLDNDGYWEDQITYPAPSTVPSNYSIAKMSISPVDPNVIWIVYGGEYGPSTDFMYKSIDGGNTWTQLVFTNPCSNVTYIDGNNNTGFKNNCFVTSIVADPREANVVFITLNAYGNGTGPESIYVSTDFGNTWINFGYDLPKEPVTAFAIDYDSELKPTYVALANGDVYYSDDNLNVWQCFSEGLPNCRITSFDFRHSTREIYASTYGRGAWKSNKACSSGIPSTAVFTANSNTPNLNTKVMTHDKIYGGYTSSNTLSPLVVASTDKLQLYSGKSITLGQGFKCNAGGVVKTGLPISFRCDVATNGNTFRKEEIQQNNVEIPISIVPQENIENQLSVYPNPTSGPFHIKADLTNDEVFKYAEVKDMTGRVLKHIEKLDFENSIEIEGIDVSTGYLLVEMVTSKKSYTKKVFIVRTVMPNYEEREKYEHRR